MDPVKAKAKARWKLVSKFLRPSKANTDTESDLVGGDKELNAVSVRRHASFNLFPTTKGEIEKEEDGWHASYEWIHYDTSSSGRKLEEGEGGSTRVSVRQRVGGKVTIKDMEEARKSGVDTTGTVCLWPAEEVMAHYLLEHAQDFEGKNVVELGAGVGLAGLALAARAKANCILLTDGNATCVASLAVAVEHHRSHSALLTNQVECRELIWSEGLSRLDIPRAGTYDYVVAADCLFFRDYHKALVHTLDTLLAEGGKALIFQPPRGETMAKFRTHAEDKFEIEREDKYDDRVHAIHSELLAAAGGAADESYNPDIHYPVLLVLKRKPRSISQPSWATMSRGGRHMGTANCPCCKGRKNLMF